MDPRFCITYSTWLSVGVVSSWAIEFMYRFHPCQHSCSNHEHKVPPLELAYERNWLMSTCQVIPSICVYFVMLFLFMASLMSFKYAVQRPAESMCIPKVLGRLVLRTFCPLSSNFCSFRRLQRSMRKLLGLVIFSLSWPWWLFQV